MGTIREKNKAIKVGKNIKTCSTIIRDFRVVGNRARSELTR